MRINLLNRCIADFQQSDFSEEKKENDVVTDRKDYEFTSIGIRVKTNLRAGEGIKEDFVPD